jgi:integrase
MDAATARGLRAGPNPAAWKGNLKALLPARAAHQRAHHAALPYRDIARLHTARLRTQEGVAAKALEFTILTAARTGEVRQATWAQFDLPNGVWTVPAAAMKANREHRVPLSARALEILKALEAERTSEFVFPSYDKGPLSTNAMLALLERMGHADITVHGFRSSFRDYAGEVSNAPHEVCEAALAHTVRNAAEAAYRRGDMIAKAPGAHGSMGHVVRAQAHRQRQCRQPARGGQRMSTLPDAPSEQPALTYCFTFAARDRWRTRRLH